MKTGIETMAFSALVLLGFLIAFSVYAVSLEIGDAKQYHNLVMERLEGAKFATSVQKDCIEEAKKHGYDLLIQKETDGSFEYQKVILKYHIHGVQGFMEDEYEVSGYSYWKGGEGI